MPRLRHHIASLGVIQIANVAIPLLTIPFIARSLGLVEFGKVSAAIAIMQVAAVLCEYGFTLSAVKEVSVKRNDRPALSECFWSCWGAQWLLTAAVAVLTGIFSDRFPQILPAPYLWTAFILVVGGTGFPLWLFQGLEWIREAAIAQLAGRISTIPLLFIMVDGPEDGLAVVALHGLAAVLTACIGLLIVVTRRPILILFPSAPGVVAAFRSGGAIFSARSISMLQGHLPTLALTVLASSQDVGLFSLADKMRRAAQAVSQPILQALFPRLSLLFTTSPKDAIALLRISFLMVLVTTGAASLVLLLLADQLIMAFGGADYDDAASVLRILAFLPLLVGISNVFGVQYLVPNGLEGKFASILNLVALLMGVSIWPVVSHFSVIGAAAAVLICEVASCFCLGLYAFRHGLSFRIGKHAPSG